MKVTVTAYLNVRVGKPSVNAPCYQYIAPGSELEVDGQLYDGDLFEGIKTWMKDAAGNYYWSGGFDKENIRNNLFTDINNKWWISDYSIPNFWASGLSGKGIKLAVLDTGVSYPHPDLDLDPNLFIDVTNSPSGTQDIDGHGTHCIGIIKAANNDRGPIGIAFNTTLYSIKITHDNAGDDESYLQSGLEAAINNNVDIISISNGYAVDLGNGFKKLIQKGLDKGILIVCAAGNITPGLPNNHIFYPALYDETLSIGAIDKNKMPIHSSILSGETKIFAPGKEILSTYLKSEFLNLSGSSQAAPYVAGVCSLLLEHKRKTNVNFKASDLKPLLIANADIYPFGRIINPMKLLN